ncbi:hypothetical protein GCM10027071_19420 [Microbacterium marinum]
MDHVGEPLSGRHCVADFEFPHNAELRAETALVKRLQVDDMAELRDRLVSGASREPLSLHVGNRPRRTSHLDDLTCLGKRWGCGGA